MLFGEKNTHYVCHPKSTFTKKYVFRLEPFFFPSTVTGENYLNMLQTHVQPSLTAKRKLSKTIFMQDGAPPHIATEVKKYLSATFTEKIVISRHFNQQWPPYSPDLNPLDYFLGGYLRECVYSQSRRETLDDLKQIV